MLLDKTVGDIQARFGELAEILEQMPVAIAVAEAPTGKLLFQNELAVHLLGIRQFPADTAGGGADYLQSCAIHEDGTPYAYDEYPVARALKGEAVAPEEIWYVHGDGARSCFLTAAVPVMDGQGRMVKVVETFVDNSERKNMQLTLALNQRRLIEALSCGDLALWNVDLATDQLELIGETHRMLGYDQAALPSSLQSWVSLIHDDDRAAFRDALARHLAGALPLMEAEYRIRQADGNWKWLLSRGKASRFDTAGKILGIAGSHLDISTRKQAELQLRDAETKLRLASDIAGLGFWEWDMRNNEVYFSPLWKRHLGYRDDELPNRYEEWESRVHPADRARVLAGLQAHLSGHESDYQVQFRLQHRDGSYRWIEARAQVLRDSDRRPLRMVGTHIDISDHKEREEQVRLIAQHDRLTNLPNRALTFELAEHCLAGAHRTGKRCAVLFIDLDGFKPINDTYGHHIGDEVLKEVAVRLRSAFRAQDTVGRIGGDEFLVIATQLDSALGATHAATHALQQLSRPYRIGDLILHSSPSIGISLFPNDGNDVETLVRHADAAMYEAKQHGKAGYRFFAVQGADQSDVQQLQHRLRESLAHQGLQLYFQPIVDVLSQQLIAAEALLRWPTPQGVTLSPDMLISIAEQSGFITELSNWVLQQACAQHEQWQQQGMPAIDMGINLSPSQLREAGMPGAISYQIEQCRIDPRHLWIEISDRAFNGTPQYTLAALDKLKALGIRMALDDFGVGYSTLEQLSRLPFDRVKIDHSLIAMLPHDKTSVAVTEAAISFGNSLGIEVVAEGLESQQVLDFLQQRHCHRVQGYFMARPMPGAQFADWYSHAGLH